MKRKIMACILAAALGITGVSFPTAAKTVSVGKNVKNITVNVKNPLDELSGSGSCNAAAGGA